MSRRQQRRFAERFTDTLPEFEHASWQRYRNAEFQRHVAQTDVTVSLTQLPLHLRVRRWYAFSNAYTTARPKHHTVRLQNTAHEITS